MNLTTIPGGRPLVRGRHDAFLCAPGRKSRLSLRCLSLRCESEKTQEGFDAPCRSVASLVKELGHDCIALLKLDVEGAEYAVLESLERDGVYPRVLCVEPDQLRCGRCWPPHAGSSAATSLAIEQWNFTFVQG